MQGLRSIFRRKGLGSSAVVVVCLLLLALISVVQVAQLHQNAADADHCALCIVMHSTAPLAVEAVLTIVLIQLSVFAPVVKARAPSPLLVSSAVYPATSSNVLSISHPPVQPPLSRDRFHLERGRSRADFPRGRG